MAGLQTDHSVLLKIVFFLEYHHCLFCLWAIRAVHRLSFEASFIDEILLERAHCFIFISQFKRSTPHCIFLRDIELDLGLSHNIQFLLGHFIYDACRWRVVLQLETAERFFSQRSELAVQDFLRIAVQSEHFLQMFDFDILVALFEDAGEMLSRRYRRNKSALIEFHFFDARYRRKRDIDRSGISSASVRRINVIRISSAIFQACVGKSTTVALVNYFSGRCWI